MPEKFLTSINWLDLVMIIVLVAAVYRGTVQGFVIEVFKVFGLFFATIFSLHFYSQAATYLKNTIALPFAIGLIISYAVIIVFFVLLFRLVAQGWMLILKTEAKAGFHQWGGAFLGVLTGVLLCGLLFLGILMFKNNTFDKFAKHSITGFYLIDLSPKVYKVVYEGLIIPFFPDEPRNERPFTTVEQVLAQ